MFAVTFVLAAHGDTVLANGHGEFIALVLGGVDLVLNLYLAEAVVALQTGEKDGVRQWFSSF